MDLFVLDWSKVVQKEAKKFKHYDIKFDWTCGENGFGQSSS